jgi:hypothetical protein
MRRIVVVALILVGACARSQPRPQFPPDIIENHQESWREFDTAASAFSVADGVDQSEAQLLAQAYFVWKISGCGFPESPVDAGTEWQARPRIGYAGEPGNDLIRINKRTGVVSYASERPIAAKAVMEHERRRLLDNLRTYVGDGAAGRK